MTFFEKVAKIQQELKAPKSQRNNFGNYNYRNQEDILEAVKPLLNGLVLNISDEMVSVGGRIYVKATATITDGTNTVVNVAYAREPEQQKGMNEAQITGATSSYARKYCLNGLFLIDDTKDADTDEVTALTRGEKMPEKKQEVKKQAEPKKEELKSDPAAASAGQKNNAIVGTGPVTEVKMSTPAKKGGWGKPKTETNKTSEGLY